MYQRPSEPLSTGGVLDNGIQLFKASVAKTFPFRARWWPDPDWQ